MSRLVLLALVASCAIEHHHYMPPDAAVPTPDALADGPTASLGTQQVVTDSPSIHFGRAVAISGDGSRLAVASGESIVVVFHRQGTSWAFEHRIVNLPSDQLGTSLALSHDGTVLAVGARGLNSVLVYRYGVDWQLSTQMTPATPNHVGDSISISADGTTLAVAARVPDGPIGDGSVFVSTFAGNMWSTREIVAPPMCRCNFGYAVAMSDAGDAFAIAALGKIFFERAGVASEQGLVFGGTSVALSPDGFTAVSMSPQESVVISGANVQTIPYAYGGEVSGFTLVLVSPDGAFKFERGASAWEFVAEFRPQGTARAVALDNTASTIVVGAPDDQNGAGAVYVFTRN